MFTTTPDGDDPLQAAALETWGTSPKAGHCPGRVDYTDDVKKVVGFTPPTLDSSAPELYVRFSYAWMVGTTINTASRPIYVSDYAPEADWFQVQYQLAGATKWWIYRDGSGTYPLLDAVFQPAETAGTFFPFVYFRHAKTQQNVDKTTDAYKTSVKLVKYLGMDFDQVTDQIGANPDIADVEQAVLMMAVPANTDVEIERRYLYEFFDNMNTAGNPGSLQYPDQNDLLRLLNDPTYEKLRTLFIKDDRFSMAIQNRGIVKRRVAGSIGEVGTHDSGYHLVSSSFTFVDATTGDKMSAPVSTRQHYFRRQMTLNAYDEIVVEDLRSTFRVFEEFGTTFGADSEILVIPVDHAITKPWSMTDRELIYARGLHYVFNSRVVTHLAWYEGDLFKGVLIVIAIVLAFWTGGQSLTLVAALLAAGEIAIAAMVIVGLVLEYLAFSLAFKLFVKVVGVEAAFVIAIVAACFGVAGSLDMLGPEGAPWAQDLLSLSSGITKAANTEIQTEFKDLLGEASDFQKYVKDQTKLLDDAKKLLEGNIHLDPFVIFGETPREYYDRTVHSGNIGVVGISAVSNYVDMALTLPKLQDSIPGGLSQ
jgi:hypothetical protein